MAVEVDGVALDPDAFLARFEVSEKALGRWLRAAVDEALDRAERSQS